MEKQLLALILGQLCIQTRLDILLERSRLGLITFNQFHDSLISLYDSTTSTLEIATKLLNGEMKDN